MDGNLCQCLAPDRFEMLIWQFSVAAIVFRIRSFYFSCSIVPFYYGQKIFATLFKSAVTVMY